MVAGAAGRPKTGASRKVPAVAAAPGSAAKASAAGGRGRGRKAAAAAVPPPGRGSTKQGFVPATVAGRIQGANMRGWQEGMEGESEEEWGEDESSSEEDQEGGSGGGAGGREGDRSEAVGGPRRSARPREGVNYREGGLREAEEEGDGNLGFVEEPRRGEEIKGLPAVSEAERQKLQEDADWEAMRPFL